MQEAGESATQALRASFAGSAPPDITRKITACVACRKQKASQILRVYSATHAELVTRSSVTYATSLHVLGARNGAFHAPSTRVFRPYWTAT